MTNPYILSKEVKPIKYNLELTPNFKDFKYIGKENIEINVLKQTNKITLNSQDLTITKSEIENNKLKNISYNKKYDTVTFTFNNSLKNKINLYLEFKGRIRDDLRGWYKSKYNVNDKEKIMLTTQFEATDARKCFPCFDQPDLKAKFLLKLNIPKDLDAISNMPIKKNSIKNNIKEINFQETPIMSTYLLAFVISKLEYVEGKTKNNVKVRIYTTPGKKYKAKFALDVTIKSLEYYNDYFKIKYPLPKLDLIAIPDFESGAMENWGLITYRETQLLFDEKESSAGVKQAVALTITHELAHQWFGNLVTMKWWNDLWLNEGFASWIEYKATNHIFPEFDIWTQYLTDEKIPALYLDSLESSHPIEVPVFNPGQINEIFDAISYNKGSCVIRMLEQYLGEEVFRNGLKYYLNKFKYANATTDDLWISLQKISKKPVKEFMHLWTKQTGYPIISMNKNKLSQEKFSYLNKKNKTLWHINLSAFENNKINNYGVNKTEFNLKNANVLLNPGQVGFYRVNYDNESFYKLMNSNLNIIDKIGIQNDLYASARGCKIPLKNYIKFIRRFKNETNHALWDDIAVILGSIEFFFFESHSEKIDKFIRELFSEIYKKVGWDKKEGESHTDFLLRMNVLSTLGFSNHKGVLYEAKKRFDEHLKNKNLDPNLRGVVYGLVAYEGDKKTFETLKNIYLKEKIQEERMRLLGSLCSFKQKEILKKSLEFSLSKNVRTQDAYAVVSLIGGNEYSGDLAWEFLKKNWNKYYKMYGEGHHMSILIKSVLSRYKSPDKIKEIRDFFKKHKVPSAKRAIEQSIEMIRINYNFINNNKDLGL